MKQIFKKLIWAWRNRYCPYPLYLWYLITERHLKHRVGECIDCIACCQCVCGRRGCYCQYANQETLRCDTYNARTCNVWFPISPQELAYRATIQRGFQCSYTFETPTP